MRLRWLWILISANLLVLVALAFVYPNLMVSPGPLIPDHAALATDCFACHAPLRGVDTGRCIACHAVADIGVRSTAGVPIKPMQAGGASPVELSFHRQLIETDCMACHSDHAGPRLNQRNRETFSHELLQEVARDRCETCHKAPTNALHRQIKGSCAQCHSPTAWEPAIFSHDEFFLLDRNHDASCATCHVADDFSKFTCYGCHEHTPAKIRREHAEEGIRNFENCVACHRSAHGETDREGRRERD